METGGCSHIDLTLCKSYELQISQPLLSQYCFSARVLSKKRKQILAQDLAVNQFWLMGFDEDRNTGVEIDSMSVNADYDTVLPIQSLLKVYNALGYQIDKTKNGHFISKDDLEVFLYNQNEI